MKDTRSVHMGTYEVNKKHTDKQISILNTDVKLLASNLNRVHNELAIQRIKIKRTTRILIGICVINALLAISLTLIL